MAKRAQRDEEQHRTLCESFAVLPLELQSLVAKRPLTLAHRLDLVDFWVEVARTLLPDSEACLCLLATCRAAMDWLRPLLRHWIECGWRKMVPMKLVYAGLASSPRDAVPFVNKMNHLAKCVRDMNDRELGELLFIQFIYDCNYRACCNAIIAGGRHGTGHYKYCIRLAVPKDPLPWIYMYLDNAWRPAMDAIGMVVSPTIAGDGTVADAVYCGTSLIDLHPVWYMGPAACADVTLRSFFRQSHLGFPVSKRLEQIYTAYLQKSYQ